MNQTQPAPNIRRIAGKILGAVAIAIGIWALVLPLFTKKTANEKLEDINTPAAVGQPPSSEAPVARSTPQAVSQGTFSGINARQTAGRASLLKAGDRYVLRLEDDFSVTNGPDLYVGFGNGGKVDSDNALVARLKANGGGQNYEIPANIDPTKYTQVFIHCRAFAYSFGVANLTAT